MAQQALQSELDALRSTDSLHISRDALAQGSAKLHQLNVLRDQLVGGANGVPVAALRASIASAVADIRAYTSDARTVASSAQNATTAQVLSMVEYQRSTAELDRKIAQSYAEESTHLAYARDIARRYGVDISGYEQERSDLEKERDAAQRRGDKVGERKADALIARNTYNTMAGELDSITDPKERARHLEEMAAQQRIVDERKAALAAQIELEGRRQAADLNLSPSETNAYVSKFRDDTLAQYEVRANALKGSDKSAAAHVELETALRRSVASVPVTPPTTAKPHPVEAALTPAVREKAAQAAAIIRATSGKSANSLADFGDSPDQVKPAQDSEPSAITLDTTADAHKTVVAPTVGAKPATGQSTSLGHS